MSQTFTIADVQKHNTKDDLYLVIHGKVYNGSSFVDEHPGGADILLEVAGGDATEAYNEAAHSEEADEILQDLEIGTLNSDSSANSDPVSQAIVELNGNENENSAKDLEVIQGVLKPDFFQDFKLQEKTTVSENVYLYRFKLPDPTSIFGLPVGQHISIGAPILQPDGTTKEIVRSYTPISSDHEPGYFDLLVKTYPQGIITQHLASLSIGQSIRVRGPKGNFSYTPNMVRHFGMIAGGSGITPMLQIIREIMRGRESGDKTEVDLIFANVCEQDILLRNELDDLDKKDAGIRVHYVLNNPPESWNGGVGFVTADMITKWLPKPANDVKILLCGPPPMISAMKKVTEGLGYERSRPVSKVEDQVFAF